MVRVTIGPSLPVSKRHGAEHPVHGLERVRPRGRKAIDTRNRPREISGELGRSGSFRLRVEHGTGWKAARPWKGRPQHDGLDDRTPARRNRGRSRPGKQNHRGSVTEVTQHLLRRHRSPAARTVRTEHLQTCLQRQDDFSICDGSHRRQTPWPPIGTVSTRLLKPAIIARPFAIAAWTAGNDSDAL